MPTQAYTRIILLSVIKMGKYLFSYQKDTK